MRCATFLTLPAHDGAPGANGAFAHPPRHPAPYDGIKEEIQGMAQLRWRIQLSAR
jgi:hypothetical protein